MKFIWLGLFFETVILALLKQFIIDFEAASIIAVSIHVVFAMIVLMSYKAKIKVLFLGAYFSRVAFMIWDLYFRHIFVLPNSGADSEMFYNQALYFSESLTNLIYDSGGLYSKINGFIFYIIGPQRMFGQYINVLLGLSIVFIVYKILRLLDVSPKICITITLLAAFFPNSLIMSAIFLREIFPTFFVTTSLYYFIRWFKVTGSYSNIVLTLIMLGIASMFHSGVIGIAIGYVFAFMFYKKETLEFRFTTRTIISFTLIVLVAWLGFTLIGDKILYKFGFVDEISDIYSTANSRRGGSAYLTSLTVNSPLQLILFGPIKSLFFLIAPLPMNWRGGMDVFTFFTDSLLYLSTIVYYLKNKKRFGDRRALVISIVVMIIGASLIFGIGVGNAGTAVRHRQKLVPLFLILIGIMIDGKKSYINKINSN